MKKCILIISILFFVTSSYAEEDRIDPFGNFKWTDNFVEVITKLWEFNGIEQIKIRYNGQSIDITKISDEQEISSILSELIVSTNSYWLKPQGRSHLEAIAIKYVDKNNEKKICLQSDMRIQSGPIMISGVPYNIIATFIPMPGLAIVSPEKVLSEKQFSLTFPFALQQIKLKSQSSLLLENFQKINNILLNKYKPFDQNGFMEIHRTSGKLQGGGIDAYGNSIGIESDGYVSSITYSSGYYLNELNDAYNKHIMDLENKKHSGKQDMSSEL